MKNKIETKRSLNILSRAINNGYTINQTQQFDQVISNCVDFLIDNNDTDIEEEIIIENNSIIYCDKNGYEYSCLGEFFTSEDKKRNEGKKFVVAKVINSDAKIVSLYVDLGKNRSKEIINAIDVALRYNDLSFENRLSYIKEVVEIKRSIINRIENIFKDYDSDYNDLSFDEETGVDNTLDEKLTNKYIEKIINLID